LIAPIVRIAYVWQMPAGGFHSLDIGHTMFILIEYNRRKGEVVSMRRFADAEWACAMDAQFTLEKSVMQRGIDHEVVQNCGLRIADCGMEEIEADLVRRDRAGD